MPIVFSINALGLLFLGSLPACYSRLHPSVQTDSQPFPLGLWREPLASRLRETVAGIFLLHLWPLNVLIIPVRTAGPRATATSAPPSLKYNVAPTALVSSEGAQRNADVLQ